VRKYFLSIVVFFCFLIAISSAGNSSAQKFTAVAVTQGDLYSALSVNYPHSEFEVNCHPISANTSSRQQNLHGFLFFSEFTDRRFHSNLNKDIATVNHIFSKQYLDHIYPSHNFW